MRKLIVIFIFILFSCSNYAYKIPVSPAEAEYLYQYIKSYNSDMKVKDGFLYSNNAEDLIQKRIRMHGLYLNEYQYEVPSVLHVDDNYYYGRIPNEVNDINLFDDKEILEKYNNIFTKAIIPGEMKNLTKEEFLAAYFHQLKKEHWIVYDLKQKPGLFLDDTDSREFDRIFFGVLSLSMTKYGMSYIYNGHGGFFYDEQQEIIELK